MIDIVFMCLIISSLVISKGLGIPVIFQLVHLIIVYFKDFQYKKAIILYGLSFILFIILAIWQNDFTGIMIYLAIAIIVYLKTLQFKIEEENRYLKSELLKQIDIDSMSGLYTNKYVYDYLQNRLKHIDNQKLSIIMMDVDNFKRINEKLGHRYGDDLIKRIASTLQSLTDETDVIGRYGGEEFIMIINNGDLEKTLNLAEDIKTQIGNIPIRNKLGLTMNLGIAFYNNETASELISCANEKLIHAKSLGKH